MTTITIEREIHFTPVHGGNPTSSSGRVPHVSKLMALAIHLDHLVQSGTVPDYACLARLGQVTRARITQIMNLLHLAPAIQEDILFLPRTLAGRAPLILRDLQPLVACLSWPQQHRLWLKVQASRNLR